MTCTLQGAVYDWACADCMVRKIKSLRSDDKRKTRELQLGTFERMGAAMAEQVKAILKGEAA